MCWRWKVVGVWVAVFGLMNGAAWAQGTWRAAKGRLLSPRDAHAVLMVNGSVLLIGGRTNPEGRTTRTVEQYDLATGLFTFAAPMTQSRAFLPSAFLDGEKTLLPGGFQQVRADTTIGVCEIYDPIRDEWAKTGAMQTPRELHTATRLPNGTVLIAAGFCKGDIVRSAEIYEPAKGAFHAAKSLREARFGHSAVLIGERVLVLGGRAKNDVSLATTEWYDPRRDEWTPGPPMHSDRFRHTTTTLADGRVLIIGGYSSLQGKTLDTAEIYDPATNTFTNIASTLSDGRMDHAATRLKDGRVLITGGWCSQKARTVASADLFDPVTGTFTPAAPLPASRHEHAAVLLPDGTVLVTGGLQHEPGRERTLDDAYLYAP